MKPAASVIISTYNQPNWLRLVLLAYSLQSSQDFELIIADDGSDDRTREVITEFQQNSQLTIRHEWQPDDGFRKCRILNQATRSSRSHYLIYSDGDCIPRRDFVETHLGLKRSGHFLSGGYVKLPRAVSVAINEQVVVTGDFARRAWLVRHGHSRLDNLSKLCATGALARWLNRVSRTRAGWHGHNASCWKSDAMRVNGFDERMGWGGEDREFGYRLVNAGVQPRRIRYSAICVHLFHDRPWRDEEVLRYNDQLRQLTRSSGAAKTNYGLRRLRN